MSAKELMEVEITKEEFDKLPPKTRRRIRRKAREKVKHAQWLAALDEEEDP